MSSDTPTTEVMDKLFLELSQFTKATTAKELKLERDLATARQQLEAAHRALLDCERIAKQEGGCDLWDAKDNYGKLYQSQWLSDILTAARRQR